MPQVVKHLLCSACRKRVKAGERRVDVELGVPVKGDGWVARPALCYHATCCPVSIKLLLGKTWARFLKAKPVEF